MEPPDGSPWSEEDPIETITIVLADDHEAARGALRDLLVQSGGLVVVAEAADGAAAVRLAREHQPDVVLMDVMMPELNGIEATRRLVAELPSVRVLAVSMHGDRRFVEAMLEAGVAGYLLKDDAAEELATAVRAVAAGRGYLSSGLSGPPMAPGPAS